MSALAEGAQALGIELSAAQIALLDQLGAAVREGNQRMNLTRIVDPAEVETKHFLDSLTAAIPLLDRLREGEVMRLVDVGAGAGFPGLPLKIAFPSLRLTLVESVGKKARFLAETVAALGLSDVEVLAQRSETAARLPDHRDAYDWATGRALGPLPVVVELCAPFLAPGGMLVAQRRGDLDAEMLAAAPAFTALQLWAQAPVTIDLAPLADGRGLVVAEKHGPTPEKYPRRPGIPAKEPIQREVARPHPPSGPRPRTGTRRRRTRPAASES